MTRVIHRWSVSSGSFSFSFSFSLECEWEWEWEWLLLELESLELRRGGLLGEEEDDRDGTGEFPLSFTFFALELEVSCRLGVGDPALGAKNDLAALKKFEALVEDSFDEEG